MISLSGSLETDHNQWLFKDINLELFDAGWTCLLGPSGVGKTTVLRLLAGLETHGEFSGELGEYGQLPNCSYMAQQDLLMPWLDVLGNVTLGATLRSDMVELDRAAELISRVGLSEHINKTPRQLSGGMRQRAALARTLMEDQSLVLLDEPFSALDAKTRAEMQELAHELLGSKTVLLVTHDPAEAARLGDRNYILDTDGLSNASAKKKRSISDPSSSETLKLQAQLLKALRREAA